MSSSAKELGSDKVLAPAERLVSLHLQCGIVAQICRTQDLSFVGVSGNQRRRQLHPKARWFTGRHGVLPRDAHQNPVSGAFGELDVVAAQT